MGNRNQQATSAAGVPYRVVQWATGNIGARSLRRVIEHPDLELVGLHVHSADKAGRDAGEIAGLAPTGVLATSDIEAIVALKPDCVLYMPLRCNFDEVCRLLESGINIVTTRGEFHNPALMDPAVRARVEQACRTGNASIHSTGVSPGFITEALPLVLASIQRSLTSLTIDEYADCSSRDSPDMIFQIMGFGQKPGASAEARMHHLRDAFGPSLQLTAQALGLECDALEVSGSVGLARNDVKIAAGLVHAGTIAAQKTTVSAMRGGKALIAFTAIWYVATDVDSEDGQPWDLRPSGWHVVMNGDAPLDVSITYPVAPEDYAAMTPGLTAHRPVNMVRYVCDAPAGIRTSVELPQVLPTLAQG